MYIKGINYKPLKNTPGKPMEIMELMDQSCRENKTVVFIRIQKTAA